MNQLLCNIDVSFLPSRIPPISRSPSSGFLKGYFTLMAPLISFHSLPLANPLLVVLSMLVSITKSYVVVTTLL